MKTKKLKLLTIFLLLFPLCVVLLGAGCEKDEEYSNLVEGYVVGSFIADEVNSEGQATGNKTPRGYCILLERSENESMDFYAFNFPDTLFSFPGEILSPNYNGYDCGPTFFPDSLKYIYKIKFKYQIVDELNKVQFVTECLAILPVFSWDNYDQVIVNETAKN
jgi:hypothetical protein